MVSSFDLTLDDGRTLRVHDSADTSDGPGNSAANTPTLLWLHGTPQTGAPLEPVLSAARARGIRLLSYGRPSYGGSTPQPGRTIGSAAHDVEQIMDELGIERMSLLGASGGSPHALACAALLPERITAVAGLANMAPPDAEGLDWFAGMAGDGAALRAATRGREARATFAETAEFDGSSFNAADYAALEAQWQSMVRDVDEAASSGPDGEIDDDVAYVSPWGFDVTSIAAPVLLVQGGDDRILPVAHAQWLLQRLPNAELWLRPRDGHVSVMNGFGVAMDWLRERP